MTPANSENSILLRLDALKKSIQMYAVIDSELKKTIKNIDSNYKTEIERIADLYQVYSEYLDTEINQSPTDESYTNKLNLIINNFNKKLQIYQQESHDIDEVELHDKDEVINDNFNKKLQIYQQESHDIDEVELHDKDEVINDNLFICAETLNNGGPKDASPPSLSNCNYDTLKKKVVIKNLTKQKFTICSVTAYYNDKHNCPCALPAKNQLIEPSSQQYAYIPNSWFCVEYFEINGKKYKPLNKFISADTNEIEVEIKSK